MITSGGRAGLSTTGPRLCGMSGLFSRTPQEIGRTVVPSISEAGPGEGHVTAQMIKRHMDGRAKPDLIRRRPARRRTRSPQLRQSTVLTAADTDTNTVERHTQQRGLARA